MTPAEFRAARQQIGLTQAELAERLKMSRKSVLGWEAGRICVPGPVALLVEWWSTGRMPEPLVLEEGDVTWDVEKRVLSYDDDHVHFSINEAGLLDLLWRADRQLVSHDKIERHIWGLLDVDAGNCLNNLKCKVDKKIPDHFPVAIHNIPNWQGEGGGYWLER